MTEWPILETLERETAHERIRADAGRLSFMRATPAALDYVMYLERVYGFEAPIEIAFSMTPGLDQVIDLRGRHELRLLRGDLNALGVIDPAATLRSSRVAPFVGIPEALAWMFVVDRNHQINQQIHDALSASELSHELTIAGSYLGSFARCESRYTELSEALDRVCRTPDRVVHAAKHALRCEQLWFERRATGKHVACRKTARIDGIEK